jgi:hypothetical protein
MEEKRGDMLHTETVPWTRASKSRLVAHMQQALGLSVRADDGFHPDHRADPGLHAPRDTERVVHHQRRSCSSLQLVTLPFTTRFLRY